MSERIRWTKYNHGYAVGECGRFTIEPMLCGSERTGFVPADCRSNEPGPPTQSEDEAVEWCEQRLDRESPPRRAEVDDQGGLSADSPSVGR
jgi:hypothetical protein